MISSIIVKVNAARKARMATKALSQALVDGNLEQIEQALADGANPDKASMEFEMPTMHFRKSYEVCGGVDIAVHQDRHREVFEALFMAGATPGSLFQKNAADGTSRVCRQDLPPCMRRAGNAWK